MDYEDQVALEKLKSLLEYENQAALEKWKIEEQNKQFLWQENENKNTESWKATIEYSKIAIQSLITISGGATIALAAFIGSALSKNYSIQDISFLMNFINASILACVCAGLSYLGQYCFTHDSRKLFTIKCSDIGNIFQILAIVVYLLGLFQLYYGANVLIEKMPILNSKNVNEKSSLQYFIIPSQ